MSAPIHCICLSVPPMEECKSTRHVWIWTSPLPLPSKQFHSSQAACSHVTHNNAQKKILLPVHALMQTHQLAAHFDHISFLQIWERPKWKQQQLSAPGFTMEATSVKVSFKNISGSLPHLYDDERTLCVDAFKSDNYYQMYYFFL